MIVVFNENNLPLLLFCCLVTALSNIPRLFATWGAKTNDIEEDGGRGDDQTFLSSIQLNDTTYRQYLVAFPSPNNTNLESKVRRLMINSYCRDWEVDYFENPLVFAAHERLIPLLELKPDTPMDVGWDFARTVPAKKYIQYTSSYFDDDGKLISGVNFYPKEPSEEYKAVLPSEAFERLLVVYRNSSATPYEKERRAHEIFREMPDEVKKKLPLPQESWPLPPHERSIVSAIMYNRSSDFTERDVQLTWFFIQRRIEPPFSTFWLQEQLPVQRQFRMDRALTEMALWKSRYMNELESGLNEAGLNAPAQLNYEQAYRGGV